MLTDAIALDKSVGAGSANSTDSGWPNSTSASGLDGFFAIGDDNATGLLESQTFNTSNTTTTSPFFGILSEASSNTTSNIESNETSQPDANFTEAMADLVTNTTEDLLVPDDRQHTATGFGISVLPTPGNNQTEQSSSMVLNETNSTARPQIIPAGEANSTETIVSNNTTTTATSAPTNSSSFDFDAILSLDAMNTDRDVNSSIPSLSPSPTATTSVEQFELPSLKSQSRNGNGYHLTCFIIVAIVWYTI